MPLYEYKCSSCGKSFEELVSFSEADLTPTCPNCGEDNTQKKISAAASFSSSSRGSMSSGGCAPGGQFT